MPYLLTFLEGIVTFVSPCILPLLPVYVAFFAGGVEQGAKQAAAEAAEKGAEKVAAEGAEKAATRKTLVRALGFVFGFGLLFCLMGAFAGTLGALVVRYQRALEVVCGAVMVVFGLSYMGVFSLGALQRTLRLQTQVRPRGFASALLFGVVFGLGWTPCVGTFLASALGMAASSARAAQGVALLVCYSAGLGIPFVVSALLLDQLGSAFAWIKKNYAALNCVCGTLLVVVGILMLTGTMGVWLRMLAG